jgi:hypothetical protein
MIVLTQSGNFNNTERFLKGAKKLDIKRILESYGREGVRALASATPVDSGLTADSWGFRVTISKGSFSIVWTNSNVVKGVPIAIILQYGHGTGTGGYVQGRDYINPAIQPIFQKIADSVWLEVRNL